MDQQRIQRLRDLARVWEPRLFALPRVVSVDVGFRYVGGVRTEEVCVRVGVVQKLPASQLSDAEMVPRFIDGERTDVIQVGELKALSVDAQAFTGRRRPCPGGFSVGHRLITAGTLGVWVRRASDERTFMLSNNHVLANSNEGIVGDHVLQPGTYDGGVDPADFVASLSEYVEINFEGALPKKPSAARWWAIGKAIPNWVATLVNCPYRLIVVKPHAVEQPKPNLVDAALAVVRDDSLVDRTIEQIGQPVGLRDALLGDRVVKAGRTTGVTHGFVDGVESTSQVSYGDGKVARFTNQIVIRADSGEFSAGGDSGSAILDEDGQLVGLLFAGGEGLTIANRMSDVVSLLGVRL